MDTSSSAQLLGSLGPIPYLFVIAIGACIGSFLNVCIYRMPREISLVNPPSHCPGCERPLRWFENVPILGYFYLRGRCRSCKHPIGIVHPVVEALTALAAFLIYQAYGPSLVGLIYFVFVCALIVTTFIDIEFQIIPDEISVGGMILGLALSYLVPQLHGSDVPLTGFLRSLLGLFVGGGVLYVTAIAGDFIFKKESMGGGDIKLLAMAGTIIGWKAALLTFFLAPIIALLPGIFVLFFKRSHVVPYGPFLAAGMLVSLWAGGFILEWTGLAESFAILKEYYALPR